METDRLTYYLDILEIALICSVAFLIPVYVWYAPVVIAILGLLFLIRPRNYSALKDSAKTLGFWAMLFPFALYLIGLTYSEDITSALHNTETALSLLAFPFIATSFRQNHIEKKLQLVEISLIAGVFVIMAYSIIKAAMNYAETQDINAFFYTQLIASPHHHSYYVLFSLIILTHSIINSHSNKLLLALKIIVSLILVAFIGMLSSKITILILIVYALYIIVRLILSKRVPKWLSILVAALTIATAPALYSIPMVKYRIDSMFASIKAQHDGIETAYTRNESTTIRIKCMESATELISENWLIGTGQGDVYAEMEKKMKLRMGDNYQGTCSPHNQFLRTFASFGIMGIASLLLLFFAMFRKAIMSRNSAMVWWCIITLCFFCIEDMLSIINGVIFFCLFTGIMLMGKKQLTMDNG
ncbi:MAG: O-antigen ligase family protein [Bacteroidales bacterium]|nr:O-antigen ligase family protein [Bacteroidales bacterium]